MVCVTFTIFCNSTTNLLILSMTHQSSVSVQSMINHIFKTMRKKDIKKLQKQMSRWKEIDIEKFNGTNFIF